MHTPRRYECNNHTRRLAPGSEDQWHAAKCEQLIIYPKRQNALAHGDAHLPGCLLCRAFAACLCLDVCAQHRSLSLLRAANSQTQSAWATSSLTCKPRVESSGKLCIRKLGLDFSMVVHKSFVKLSAEFASLSRFIRLSTAVSSCIDSLLRRGSTAPNTPIIRKNYKFIK